MREARIYRIGLNRCVDIPDDLVLGEEGAPVPVVVSVAGRKVRTNLVSRGDGKYRVFLNSDLRKAAGVAKK